MFKVLCIIAVFYYSDAMNAELCKMQPQEKHCLIEWSVRDRWAHTKRYVYNWATKNCFEIRWSTHCPNVPSPATANNFPSESECLNECKGWD